MTALRVLVADDHPLFRAGLLTALELSDSVEVVGEASNGHEAVVAAYELEPDVVVMDLHMPDLNGIEATRRIIAARPETGILVLSMLEDDESVFSAMRAGARGYLLKGAGADEIARAIAAVGRGEGMLSAIDRPSADRVRRGAEHARAVPRADGPRARAARPDRPGVVERAHRRALHAQHQDRAQPRLEHPHQASPARPLAGDRARATGGSRRSLTRFRAPGRGHSERMELPAILSTNVLTIYLNDHLAGATAGVELVARMMSENEDSEFAAPLGKLCAEIGEDRDELVSIIENLGYPVDHVKIAAGWTVEKIARLKPNGQLRGYAPLSRLLELETLLSGINGKGALWRALEQTDAVEPAKLERLAGRARRQATVVRRLHREAAAISLAS